jgi:hypothetical protein
MPDYHVEWDIFQETDTPLEAAARSWADVRAEDSIANSFVVKDAMGMSVIVDLHDGTTGEPQWNPSRHQIADLADWMAGEQWPIDEIVEMIRKPHKYADEYSKMIVERAFDEVAKEPEADDETTEET